MVTNEESVLYSLIDSVAWAPAHVPGFLQPLVSLIFHVAAYINFLQLFAHIHVDEAHSNILDVHLKCSRFAPDPVMDVYAEAMLLTFYVLK